MKKRELINVNNKLISEKRENTAKINQQANKIRELTLDNESFYIY